MITRILKRQPFFPHSVYQLEKLHTSDIINNVLKETVEFSNGRTLTLETGSYAKLADGSALAKLGETAVLVTAVGKAKAGSNIGFAPITVDYRQKYAAAGRIPTNYLKRELAPSEKEILTGRAIDRSIRPLFPAGYSYETQISCQLLAVDGLYEPDVVSINAASAALSLSSLPWEGPVGAVRVGLIDGEIVIFPSRKELRQSSLNMIVSSASESRVVMLEAGAKMVPLEELKKAIAMGIQESQLIVDKIRAMSEQNAKPKLTYEKPALPDEEIVAATRTLCSTKLRDILWDTSHNKLSRDKAISEVRQEVAQQVTTDFPDKDISSFSEVFNNIYKGIFRNMVLEHETRCDGRKLTELRPITCAIDLFQPLHGSSIFQRGQTQVQCTVAYDAPDRHVGDPLLDVTGGGRDKNFFLHYSFPSFANNEVSRGGPLTRREVGHGALAAKAITPVVPDETSFSILLSSTVLESNGSSSMATVCAGSLALMDAGVNIAEPVAGVAMGLITSTDETSSITQYKVLTDILGIEDYLGDMDFKIAGTFNGVTALQADIKLSGLPSDIIMEALDQADFGKKEILRIMNETIAEPTVGKTNLPLYETRVVAPNKRSALIGVGSTNLRKLHAETGVQVTWLDENTISIFAPNKSAMNEAMEFIDDKMKSEPNLEFGAIYTANIVELRPQGVMVTLYDGMSPVLLHNSQLDSRRVFHPTALGLDVGQQVKVKYFGRDPTSGHMRISRRALLGSKNIVGNLHKSAIEAANGS